MVIQPSVLEGASLVVLEAAAYGKCCLLTDIPANRDLLGETAAYAPPDDSAALAEQIVRYSNEEALRVSLGLSARRHVQEHFNEDGVVSRYIMLYETIASAD
jgi:glycosyltransferase involved in cell wall biosynthesis